MLNVHSAGRIQYEGAASIVPLTLFQRIKLYVLVTIDVLKVLTLSIPILIESMLVLLFSKPKKSIAGQTALITGGGNGIGRAIAIELAKKGCNIAIVDIDPESELKTSSVIKAFGVEVRYYKVDAANIQALSRVKDSVEKEIGPVDILVNNVGLMPLLSLREGDSEDINKIIDVNIKSQLWATRLFLKGMMARKKGHIVGISSMSALHPMGGAIIYTATKYFMVGFMKALEQELRQEGYEDCIHYTTVYPYFVATRKDLMEAVNLRFPAITAEKTAVCTVEGILRNAHDVIIPSFVGEFTEILKILPHQMQNFVRDIILWEKDTRMFKFDYTIK